MANNEGTDLPPASQPPGDISGLEARLIKHAENIRNPAAKATLGQDLRLAARVIGNWRVGIHEVIAHTVDRDARDRLTKLLGGA